LRRSDESAYDAGSIARAPHVFLSPHRHLRKATVEGLRQSRAYGGLSGGKRVGKGDVATCLVQIVDKPNQFMTSKVPHALCIPLFAKYPIKLVVKVGCRGFEVTELLQNRRAGW